MPSKNTGKRACKDHLGKEHPSLAAMARAWNLTEAQLYNRLHTGMPLEKALTMPRPERARTAKPCQDHLGNEYPSLADMCACYGLKPYAYGHRIRRGWTVERALTTPESKNPVTDHAGNEHESIAAMCRFWDIPLQVYYTRKRQGLALDKILDQERKMGPKACSDGHGRNFPTVRALRKYWFSVHPNGSDPVNLDMLYLPTNTVKKILPSHGVEIVRKLGSCRMIRYGGHEHVMTVPGLHRLLCHAALDRLNIRIGSRDPEDAWHEYVCEKYDGLPDRKQTGGDETDHERT